MLLATFTQADDRVGALGDQDLRLIGLLRWREAAEAALVPAPPKPLPRTAKHGSGRLGPGRGSRPFLIL